MTDNRERLELAAQAAFAAFGHDVAKPMPWDQAPEDFRITFRMVAAAVLMSADLDGLRQRIETLAEKWVSDMDGYPVTLEGNWSRAAVTLCITELRAALAGDS